MPEIAVSAVTPLDPLPPEERERLARIAKARVYVSFMMGSTELRSDDCELTPGFIVHPNMGCHGVTPPVPENIKVHIQEYGYGHNCELATVFIPVYNGDAPQFMELDFTGKAIEGFQRSFVDPEPESVQTVIHRRKEFGIQKSTAKPRCQLRKMIEIADASDPNDPYLVAPIASVKAVVSGDFVIDSDINTTLFAAIAPSEMCTDEHE
jgi:hypothetical protein